MAAIRAVAISRSMLLTVSLGLTPGLAPAAGPPPIFPQSARPGESDPADCKRTLQCRQALLADPTLAALNIGVSARAGVVSLWGLVPTKDLAMRAENCLRKVPGVLEIRNEVRVGVPDAALDELLTNPERHQVLMRTEPSAPVARLASRPDSPTTALLMPPIALPSAQARPPAQPAESPWLIERVDRVRQSDRRFENVRPSVVGRVVRLNGAVYYREDIYELAQALARVPGVERVVVEIVRTIPEPRRDLRIR